MFLTWKDFPPQTQKKLMTKNFSPSSYVFQIKNLKVPKFSCISSIHWCNDILSSYRLISKAVSTCVHCTQQDIRGILVISVICHNGQWMNHAYEACWWLRVVIITSLITDYNHFYISAINNNGIHIQKKTDKCSFLVHGQSIYEIRQCGFNIAHCECLSVLQCKIHIQGVFTLPLCIWVYTFCL